MLPLPSCVLAPQGHGKQIGVSDIPVDKNSLT